MRNATLASMGGVAAAFLGSLCCIGPVFFVTLGVGAGLASTFEPLRPLFAVIMVGLFALAFHAVYSPRPIRGMRALSGTDGEGMGETSAQAGSCPVPHNRNREKVIVWIAALMAVVLWSFPRWSKLLV